MSIITMTAESLSAQLGVAVPEIYVIVAKHEVQGFDAKTVAEVLGVEIGEIDEAKRDPIYQAVLSLIRVEYAKTKSQVDLTYDSLEAIALEKLHKRIEFEKDGDFLLKVAVMANRATRRNNAASTLDPASASSRVPLTLTKRLTRKYNNDGSTEETEVQQMRIEDGSMVNPSFSDVDSLLNVSQRTPTPKRIGVAPQVNNDPDLSDLEEAMRGF